MTDEVSPAEKTSPVRRDSVVSWRRQFQLHSTMLGCIQGDQRLGFLREVRSVIFKCWHLIPDF